MYDILDFVLLFVCIIALSIKIVMSDERISKLEEKDEYQVIYYKCPMECCPEAMTVKQRRHMMAVLGRYMRKLQKQSNKTK